MRTPGRSRCRLGHRRLRSRLPPHSIASVPGRARVGLLERALSDSCRGHLRTAADQRLAGRAVSHRGNGRVLRVGSGSSPGCPARGSHPTPFRWAGGTGVTLRTGPPARRRGRSCRRSGNRAVSAGGTGRACRALISGVALRAVDAGRTRGTRSAIGTVGTGGTHGTLGTGVAVDTVARRWRLSHQPDLRADRTDRAGRTLDALRTLASVAPVAPVAPGAPCGPWAPLRPLNPLRPLSPLTP